MRAAFYRRVSTSSQVEGFSLQTQLDSLTDLAQRQGYHWEDFCDPGRSGETLEGRPELMRLLANLDRFDAVLVVDDSRLARDELTAAVIRSKLREAEVKLITLSGETDLNDPAGRFTSGVLALTAQLEQDIRREKMMAGLQAAARRGYWTGGPASYGYKCVPTPDGHTTLEVDEAEAEQLHTAISLIVDEGLTPYQACKRLKALGYRTRSGIFWSYSNLREKLERRHLLGEMPYNSAAEKIPRQYPPLITEARWEQLQAALRLRHRGPQPKRRPYPLSGRLLCRCGQKHLVGVYRRDRNARYYVCPRNVSSAITDDKCPVHPRLQRAQPVEDLIWQATVDNLGEPDQLRAAAQQWLEREASQAPHLAKERAQTESRLNQIEGERIRTFRDAKRLGLTDHETTQLLVELADEQAELQQRLDQLEPAEAFSPADPDWPETTEALAKQARQRLATSDPELQARILELLQIEITPTPSGYTIEGTIPIDTDQRGHMATEVLRRGEPNLLDMLGSERRS